MTDILVVDPLSDGRWDAFARSQHGSDVFHSTTWLRVLHDTYGFDLGAKLVVDEGEVVAGAVYADVDVFGRVSRKILAFSDFCDPLLAYPETWPVLAEALLEEGHPLTIRCRAAREPIDDGRFRQTGRVAWHRCDVTRPSEEIWQSLHPSARRAVRKADRAGVEIRAAEDAGDVRDFFALHLEVRARKYGLLAQPFAFFESIWSRFLEPGQGELLLAVREDRVVGGTLYLDWGDTAYYKFNASDVDLLGVRPNDSLLWSGIESAQKRGLDWLDFGVSDLDQPGLIRFKEKYATESGEVITLVADSGAGPAAHELQMRDLIGQMSKLASGDDVPRPVTERAGDLLYRYFA